MFSVSNIIIIIMRCKNSKKSRNLHIFFIRLTKELSAIFKKYATMQVFYKKYAKIFVSSHESA